MYITPSEVKPLLLFQPSLLSTWFCYLQLEKPKRNGIEVSTAVWINSIFSELATLIPGPGQGCEIQVKPQPISDYPSLWALCCLQSLLVAQFQCAGMGRKCSQPGTATCAPGLGELTCCSLRIDHMWADKPKADPNIDPNICSNLLVSQRVTHKQQFQHKIIIPVVLLSVQLR